MKTLPKLTVCVGIRYVRSRQWGYNPDVTVYAVLDGIRVDESHGSASGCGYDKTSAAVCRAFLDNPLLETLALWDGFDPAKPEYGPECCHDTGHGYRYRFGGQGMGVFERLMESNGFDMTRVNGADESVGYRFVRRMPRSFTAIV